MAQQRFRILHWSDLKLSADLGEGLLWYDHDFPSGGRRYNFMLQAGPTIGFASPGNPFSVSIGYRWMHVSNGSGIGPQNPSYEARGPMLRGVNLIEPRPIHDYRPVGIQ